MTKNYKITDEKFLEAKKKITSNGGTIYTDGSFEIKGVEGHFRKAEDILTIIITDKPWLASWSMIENELNKFFN